jgi:hypothetical protein
LEQREHAWRSSMEERETKAATSRMSGLTDPFVLKSLEERS